MTKIVEMYKALRELQKSDRFRKAGAWDTEPDRNLEEVIKRGVKGEPVDWEGFDAELYHTCPTEGKEFTQALKDIYDYAIANQDNITQGEIKEIRKDMWRVNWDWRD